MQRPSASSPVFFITSTTTSAISTLPYTTLFRSEDHARVRSRLKGLRNPGSADSDAPLVLDAEALEFEWADRKSTCLNSSHTVTSYAVFCLKKKKDSGRRAQASPVVKDWFA